MIILIYLLAIVAIVLLVAFLLPSSYTVSKTITVTAPIELCYQKIANLNYYKDWNPWAQMEPTAVGIISGSPNKVGHQYTWDGKKIGTGGLTIIKINQPFSVELELDFLKPFKSKAIDNWLFEQLENNQVKITWTNKGKLKFPTARLIGPMINKNLNQQFEKGLQNIKHLCEKTS